MSEYKFVLQDDESVKISPNLEVGDPHVFLPGCIKRDEEDPNRLWLDSISITINDHLGGYYDRKCKALIKLLEDAPIMLAGIRLLMEGHKQKNQIEEQDERKVKEVGDE